jgi:hypothetical protein
LVRDYPEARRFFRWRKTGGHPFQQETTPPGAHVRTVAHAKVSVAPRCHVTLNVQSVGDTIEKAQTCRRLKLANGVVVTVQHR